MATQFNDGTDTNVDFDSVRSLQSPPITTAVENIGQAVLDRVKKSGSTMTGALTLSGSPSSANHAATKAYVDSVATGSLADWKASCGAATTAALPACTYNNGAGTLTGNSNGALTAQDGVTPTASMRILVKNQASNVQNGIYVVTTVGDGGNPFVLTRATDADAAAEITKGAATLVDAGSTLAGTTWFVNVTVTTLGTDPITWVQTTAAAAVANNSITTDHIVNGTIVSTDLDSAFLDTSTDLDGGSASNTKVPTQLAVKTYVDTQVAAATTSPVTGERSVESIVGGWDWTGATDQSSRIATVLSTVSQGDTVIFPANGVCRIDSPINVTKRAVNLISRGRTTENNSQAASEKFSFRAGASMTHMLRYDGSYVDAGSNRGEGTIEGIIFDGNSNVTSELLQINAYDVRVERCGAKRIGSTATAGFRASAKGDRCNWIDNAIRGNYTASAVGIDIAGNDNMVYANRIDHCKAWLLIQAGGTQIHLNHLSNGGADGSGSANCIAGIVLRSDSCEIVGNYLDIVKAGSQILIDQDADLFGSGNTSQLRDIVITGNKFYNAANGGTAGHTALYPAIDIRNGNTGNGLRGLVVGDNTFQGEGTFNGSFWGWLHVVVADDWSKLKAMTFTNNTVRHMKDTTGGTTTRPFRPFYDRANTGAAPVPHILGGNAYAVASNDDWYYDEQVINLTGVTGNGTAQNHRLWGIPTHYFVQPANAAGMTSMYSGTQSGARMSTLSATQYAITAATAPSAADYHVDLRMRRTVAQGFS